MSLEKLDHLKIIKVTGDDRKSFLQGQLSNDINALNNSWHFSAYCSPKGRAMAVFIACAQGDELYLVMEKELEEPILKRLRMYVMRSKVVFESLENNVLGALSSAQPESLPFDIDLTQERYSCDSLCEAEGSSIKTEGSLNEAEGSLNKAEGSLNDAKGSIIALNFGGRSMLLDFTNSLEHHTGNDWITADIQEALPRVAANSSEMFVPQMLNMDLSNGINFKKGCYTGQEIIARMHYLGKLKQRTFVCELIGDAEPVIGEKIMNDAGKSLGNVVNSAKGSKLCLASLRFDNLPDILITESGAKLTTAAIQPYDLNLGDD